MLLAAAGVTAVAVFIVLNIILDFYLFYFFFPGLELVKQIFLQFFVPCLFCSLMGHQFHPHSS